MATSKKQPAKAASPKKAAPKKAAAKKAAPKKAASTDQPKKKPGRPPKTAQPKVEITVSASGIAPMTVASKVAETITKANETVIKANDVKSPSLRERMLKWFKRS